jgi:ATP-binding cassette, subfamily B, multidrug efflux pump
VARDLREAIFAKIQGFSCGNIDAFSTGKLMVRLTSDSAAAQRLVQVSLRIGTRAPISMMGSIALMFATSPALAWAMVPLLLLTGVVIAVFGASMEPRFRGVQRRLDRLNTILQENIAGARLVKAFARAGREGARFEEANEDLTRSTARVMELNSSMTPALTTFINIGVVLVVWLGGAQVAGGGLSLGRIVAFVNYLLATMNPLIMMSQLANTWANGLASAGRIDEILSAASGVPEPALPRGLPGKGGAGVDFEGVSFRYDRDSAVAALEGIGLRAEPGRTVAILGATGSGKSTLVDLIPRFYDAAAGSVSIGGIDVRELGRDSILGAVGVVPQESVLFSGSVRDNIRYGRPEAGEDEVVAAAEAAQAHGFILRLPRGYDSRVEERGVNLSGGQKQRIAIARAIIMRPRILILDDATSSVDVETETLVQEGLAGYLPDCTCFVVAQRISTVLNADKIVVIDGGRVVAEGRHAELLRSSGVYREIYDSQLGGGLS